MLVAGSLESGILSWGIPLLVLTVVGIYWAVVVLRHPEEY